MAQAGSKDEPVVVGALPSLPSSPRKGDAAPAAQASPELAPVPFRRMFCTADGVDVLLMLLGTIGALGAGVLVPMTTQAFAGFIGAFAAPDPRAALRASSLEYVGYAAAGLVAFSLQTGAWALAGQRQAEKWRARYLAAALRQDVAFYDRAASGGSAGLAQGLAEDVAALQAGISEKIGLAISDATMFVTGFVIAFTRSWSMTLVLLCSVPLIAAAAAMLARAVASSAARTSSAYAAAASVAAQAIANVRTLAAAGAERRAVAVYAEALEEPRRVGEMQGVISGVAFGWFQLAIHAGAYASALYFAATQVAAGRLTGGEAVGVMFACLIGAMALGQLGPNLQYPMRGRVAAASLLRVIERRPEIEAVETPGTAGAAGAGAGGPDDAGAAVVGWSPATAADADAVRGEIVFSGVCFSYPTTPDRRALDGFYLVVPAGKTVALVGQSGSGKSTVVSLVERFYDVSAGSVALDGRDLRSLDLRWLRSVTSLVSQEPTLFATTIYENIAVGRAALLERRRAVAAAAGAGGTSFSPNAGDDEEALVIAAAKAANAHAFIMRLPHGYLTQVGEKGLSLSGGQRQRVAIARAVLRQPRILLLDEATAALDNASERKVQAALDAASEGRTTITVAHRLSTIRGADVIAVVREGRVVESGGHDELAAREGGAYAALLSLHAASDAAAEEQLLQGARGGGGQRRQQQLSPPAAAAADDDDAGAKQKAAAVAAAANEHASTAVEAAALRQQLSAAALELQQPLGASGGGRGARRGSKSNHKPAPASTAASSAPSFSAPTELPSSERPDAETLLLLEQRRRDEEAAANPPTPGRLEALRRLGRLNAPEAAYGVVGAVASLCAGAIQPAFALSFSALIASYYLTDTRQMLRDASLFALIFVAIGVGGFTALLLQQSCFGVMGQRLSARVRVLLLASILRQEAAFFELPSSSTGELSARLSADAAAIRGAAADVVGVALQQTGTVLFGYVAAMYYDWRMALLVTAALPVMTAAFAIQTQFRLEAGGAGGGGGGGNGGKSGGGGNGGGQQPGGSQAPPKGKSRASKAAKAIGRSSAIAADAFAAVRVVHAYGLERFVCRSYADAFAPAAASARRAAVAMGVSWALAQATQWCLFAAIIAFGGDEVLSGRATYDAMLKAFLCTFFVAIGISEAMNGFSNVGAALPAAARVFAVIDRQSAIDPFGDAAVGEGGEGEAGAKPPHKRQLERDTVRLLRWSKRAGGARKPVKGASAAAAAAADACASASVAIDVSAAAASPASAELRDVVFRYPSRPQALVFDGFSLDIPPGTTQALVGESGSGKSTVVQLLLRFYDPEEGSVRLDGVDVRDWPVRELRAQIALVSQEPVLFNDTVLGNLRLARPDAPMAEVVAAARAAHAEEFVLALPGGYDTLLGEGGVQLSGGQRQRLAIARALLKRPRLLLLDEATAALDNASERKVQAALDAASEGRTTVTVAHRLSTVRGADSIAVVHRGRVLERGTHEQLLAMGPEGAYSRLIQAAGGGGGGVAA